MKPIIDQETLDKLWEVYTPPEPSPPAEYRVYYNNNEIICYSMERLDMSYIKITKDIFEECRPDLYKIINGQLIRKELDFQNKLQLVPNGTKFASIANNQQFAVDETYIGKKSFWDINDGNN